MKELDLLMRTYLDESYPDAPTAERDAFAKLLDMADPDLYSLITGKASLSDSAVNSVVEQLRHTLTART
jgi:succinate dehydrogenase flavin-adding protein (antitoxin of CptAB toxin-antitoxin module)